MIWNAKFKSNGKDPGLLLVSLGFFLSLLFLVTAVMWSDSSPIKIESLESKTVENHPVFNKIRFQPGTKKDVWFMEQSHQGADAKLPEWDKIAIVVDKNQRHAEFYQLMPGPEEISMKLKSVGLKASCFMCHSNGPRAIRPNFDSSAVKVSWWDSGRLQLWNLRIKTYGPLKSSAPVEIKNEYQSGSAKYVSLKPSQGKPFRYDHPAANEKLQIKSCTKCHNNSGSLFSRSSLTRQNFLAVRYMLDKELMPPPGFEISAEDKEALQLFF